MALTCPVPTADLGFTEFIDCSSINVNYDELGVATISLTVIAVSASPEDTSRYNILTLGEVEFQGYVSSLIIQKLTGTSVYEHKYTIIGLGC